MSDKLKLNCQARAKLVFLLVFLVLIAIEARLFYWQIIKGQKLKSQAQRQTVRYEQISGRRGKIFTSEGHLLVGNQTVYSVNVSKKLLEIDQLELVEKISPIFFKDPGVKHQYSTQQELEEYLIDKLQSGTNWVKLFDSITDQTREEIASLEINAVTLTPHFERYYPEASLAAHLVGFVGKNELGHDLGYFGVEGSLNQELTGQDTTRSYLGDAHGFRLAGQQMNFNNLNGRDVTLTIQRDIQYLIEQKLKQAIKHYQAKKGEIIVLEPDTGKILGLSAQPNYQPAYYFDYDSENYKNPCLTDLYEPGSTFKTLTVSAGIDSGAVTPDTPCADCDGPRVIGGYTIRTWNDVYNPGISVSDALAKSDNIAMIGIAERMGADTFQKYLKKFGIGQAIDLDLQEDTSTPFPKRMGRAELATTSFGQGVSVNSLQLTRAVSAIANQGVMMKPAVVQKVHDPQTNESIIFEPEKVGRVISAETADKVTKMMVEAAQHGEAQWIGKHYQAAGKTGTSQIPSPEGGYKEDATIASFIGFAPPENPKFVMLVKLVEPQSSPWAAETAAPLWFNTAEDLFLLMGIQD